jgi:hypothetical protein
MYLSYMPAIFNDLLEFRDENDLDAVLDKMDKTLAIKLLEIALDGCNDRFSIVESHVIFKCLKKLKENGFNIGNGELQQGQGHSS